MDVISLIIFFSRLVVHLMWDELADVKISTLPGDAGIRESSLTKSVGTASKLSPII